MLHTSYTDRSSDLGSARSNQENNTESAGQSGDAAENASPLQESTGEGWQGGTVKYRCKICGYIHEGELPEGFVCPVCKQPASMFEKTE